MTFNQMRAAAEAILFAAGEPVETAKIAQALDIEIEDAETVLRSCAEQLDERESGVCLLKLGERYQLCTRQEYAENIRSVLDMKRNVPLSSAAFEVLAVVAYNQPVTKAYVEQVRGVDCSGVISTLCQKGLVEERADLIFPADRCFTVPPRSFSNASASNLSLNCRSFRSAKRKSRRRKRKRLKLLKSRRRTALHSPFSRNRKKMTRTLILTSSMSTPASSKICMNNQEVLV